MVVSKAPPGGFLSDRLVALVVVAAGLGALLPQFGAPVAQLSLAALAVLVFGVGLTLSPASLGVVWHAPRLVALATLLPWLVLIPLALLVARGASGPVPGGLLALAAAPTEVSAVLLTVIGGGEAGLAAAVVVVSLLVSPLIVAATFALAGLPGATDPIGLLMELGLGVGLPLVAALVLRKQAVLAHYGSDIGAVGLVLLMVGAGASARLTVEHSPLNQAEYALAAAGLLVVLVLPPAVGTVISRLLHLPARQATAVVFACGMREFGVATAVAQLADPTGTAIPVVYGIVLILLAAVFATRLARRLELHDANLPGQPGAEAAVHHN